MQLLAIGYCIVGNIMLMLCHFTRENLPSSCCLQSKSFGNNLVFNLQNRRKTKQNKNFQCSFRVWVDVVWVVNGCGAECQRPDGKGGEGEEWHLSPTGETCFSVKYSLPISNSHLSTEPFYRTSIQKMFHVTREGLSFGLDSHFDSSFWNVSAVMDGCPFCVKVYL